MGVLTIRKDSSSGTVLHTESGFATPTYSPNPTGSITSGAVWNCKNKVPNSKITIGGKTFECKDNMMDRNFWAMFDASQPVTVYDWQNGGWGAGFSSGSFNYEGRDGSNWYIPYVKTESDASIRFHADNSGDDRYGFVILKTQLNFSSNIKKVEVVYQGYNGSGGITPIRMAIVDTLPGNQAAETYFHKTGSYFKDGKFKSGTGFSTSLNELAYYAKHDTGVYTASLAPSSGTGYLAIATYDVGSAAARLNIRSIKIYTK